MAKYDKSTTTSARVTPKQGGDETNSQVGIISNSSSINSDLINEGVPHHRWMQEYHKSRLYKQPARTPLLQQSVSNSYHVISPHLMEHTSTIDSTTVKLNGLKIDPGTHSSHKQGQHSVQDITLKRNKTDLADGYKMYRGPSTITIGISKGHSENLQLSTDIPKSVGSEQDSSKSVAHRHELRASLPSFFYPENLVIPKHESKDSQNQKHYGTQFYTSPFRNHLPPRPRPQSATISSSPKTVDKVKGSKSKQTVRKGRPPLPVTSKVPSLRQSQSSKLKDAHSPKKEASPSSSRQLGLIPKPSFKLDIDGGLKSVQQNSLTPKSILKNNIGADANFYLASSTLKPQHELLYETSGKISPSNSLTSDFNFNDFIFSQRDGRRTSSLPRQTSPSTRLVASTSHMEVTKHKRPMSAYASPSKYELSDSQSPRRKSVTFNSYVSLMAENRVSTIRSLSIDV